MQSIDAYQELLTEALMTLDMGDYFGLAPIILSRLPMTLADTTEFSLYLVQEDMNYVIWVVRDERHLEYSLCSIPESVYLEDWREAMLSGDIVKTFDKIFREVSGGGNELLCEQMDREGVLNTLGLVVGENRLGRALKLHRSCAFSVCGQVFNGVRGLEEYCRIQKDDSSPYVLKKNHAEFYMGDEYYCYNYLICKTKEDAESWMRGFVNMDNVSPFLEEGISFPEDEDFPPLVAYYEGCGYMVLIDI